MAGKPLILGRDNVPDEFFKVLSRYGEIARLRDHADPLAYIREHGTEIRAMFCAGTLPNPPGLIEAMPSLGMICSLSAGYEGLPMDLCKERGIIVCNSSGSNADDVADTAVTHVLAQQLGLLKKHAAILSGVFEGGLQNVRRSLMQTRIGIVGLGAIGLCTAQRLAPHGCDIAWWGPNNKPGVAFRYEPSLKQLAEWCHILVITGRADASNRHMISKEIIEAVGPEGIIVNVTRGSVIDEDAMIAALKSGKLAGAGLDVFAQEPTPAERWKDVPNVTLTPHAGGAGTYSVQRYYDIASENFECFFTGKPILRRVN